MKYLLGPYAVRDIKRFKKISSLEKDIENHYKIFRGKVTEKIVSEYKVPLAQAFLYKVELGENIKVLFYKDRCAVTNPKMSPSEGLRIIFGLYVKDQVPLKYTPFIIFLAKEEGERYLCPNGKEYPLKSSSFKHIIEAKLEYHEIPQEDTEGAAL